jgi:hypothetical protein
MSLIRKNPTASVTAAVRPLNIRNTAEATAISMVSGGSEQREAWKFYRTMSELNYPVNYLGRAVGRFKFPVGVIPDNDLAAGATVPDVTERDDLYRAAEEIMFFIRGEEGGISELAEAYTKNMAVAGEGWFVARMMNGEPVWSMFSVLEFGPNGSFSNDTSIAYSRYPTGNTSQADSSYVPRFVRRAWQPSPALHDLADTTTFAVLNNLRTLAVLDRSLRARILNKLTQSGFLFMPSQLTMSGPVGAPTGDGQKVDDPFAAKILSIIQAQNDMGEAPAMPALIRGDAALGEAIKFITTDRTIDHVELELRAEQRSGVARGMFLPPEVVEGMGSLNHFSSWSVSDSAYQHVLPYANGFADMVTHSILWPLLRDVIAAKGWNFTERDVRRHLALPDGSEVITRPNEAEDGRQLHDRAVISDRALRDRSNVSELDAPTEEEYVRQIGRKINHPYLATWGMPIHDKIDWDEAAAAIKGEGAPGIGSVDQAHRPADSSDPAGAPGEGDTQVDNSATATLLAAAAPGYLLSAHKKVGAKLRGRAEPNKKLHAAIKNLPNEKVLTHDGLLDALGLTAGEVRRWYVAELAPIAHATPSVDRMVTYRYVQALAAAAVDGEDPDPVALAVTCTTSIRED